MMSLNQKKESGFSISAQFGEAVAGVPIKKRPLQLFEQPSSSSSIGHYSSEAPIAKCRNSNNSAEKVEIVKECAARSHAKSGAANYLQDLHSVDRSYANHMACSFGSSSKFFLKEALDDRAFLVKQEHADDHMLDLHQMVGDNVAPIMSRIGSSSGHLPALDLNVPALDLGVSLGTLDHIDGPIQEKDADNSFNKRAVHEETAAVMASNFGGMRTIASENTVAAGPPSRFEVPWYSNLAFRENNLKSSNSLNMPFISTNTSGKTVVQQQMDSSSDLTLDLQLKLPARPELGRDWKEECPPELSLSLFGKETETPSPVIVKPEPLEFPCGISTPTEVERRLGPDDAHLQNDVSTSSPKDYETTADLTLADTIEKGAVTLRYTKVNNKPVEGLTRLLSGQVEGKTHDPEKSFLLACSLTLSERPTISSRTDQITSPTDNIDLNAEVSPQNCDFHSGDSNDVGEAPGKNCSENISSSILTSDHIVNTSQIDAAKSVETSSTQSDVLPRALDCEQLPETGHCDNRKLLKVGEISACSDTVDSVASSLVSFVTAVSPSLLQCPEVTGSAVAQLLPGKLPKAGPKLPSLSEGSASMDCSDDENCTESRETAVHNQCNVQASTGPSRTHKPANNGIQESSSSCTAEVCLDALRTVNGSDDGIEVKKMEVASSLRNDADVLLENPSAIVVVETLSCVDTSRPPGGQKDGSSFCRTSTLEVSVSPSKTGVVGEGCREPEQKLPMPDAGRLRSEVRTVSSTVDRPWDEKPSTVVKPFLHQSRDYQHVNRNERWDRFVGSELESNYRDSRHEVRASEKNYYRDSRHEVRAATHEQRQDKYGADWGWERHCGSPKHGNSKRARRYDPSRPSEMMPDLGKRRLRPAGEQMDPPHYRQRRLSPASMDGPMPPRRMMRSGSPGRICEMKTLDSQIIVGHVRAPMHPVRRDFPVHPRWVRPTLEDLGRHDLTGQSSPQLGQCGRLGPVPWRHFLEEPVERHPGSPPPYGSVLLDGHCAADVASTRLFLEKDRQGMFAAQGEHGGSEGFRPFSGREDGMMGRSFDKWRSYSRAAIRHHGGDRAGMLDLAARDERPRSSRYSGGDDEGRVRRETSGRFRGRGRGGT